MSTSRRHALHTSDAYATRLLASVRHYAMATVACVVFSAVYEHFSHGVISWWMVGLAGWPLVLGLLPAAACVLGGVFVPQLVRQLWACGVMTLAMGSCLRGVLEIYGTTSALVDPYLPVGVVLLGLAALLMVVAQAMRARMA